MMISMIDMVMSLDLADHKTVHGEDFQYKGHVQDQISSLDKITFPTKINFLDKISFQVKDNSLVKTKSLDKANFQDKISSLDKDSFQDKVKQQHEDLGTLKIIVTLFRFHFTICK